MVTPCPTRGPGVTGVSPFWRTRGLDGQQYWSPSSRVRTPGSSPASHRIWNPLHEPSTSPPPATNSRSASTDRKSTRLNSSHVRISYAVFCLRSKEHTSELQSRPHLVCRLLLENKKD